MVAGLIYWLVDSGKLDFHQLSLLVQDPVIFFSNLAVWGMGYILLGTFRWYILLRGVGVEVAFFRAMQLQLIGIFFNTAMPGAVGGDIVKALYVIREQQTQRKTATMLTVLLDRVIGLAALFVLAGVAVAVNWSFFVGNTALMPLMIFVMVGLGGLLVGFGVVMYPFRPGRDPLDWVLRVRVPGFGLLAKLYEAMRSYRKRPLTLVMAVGLSCIIQCGAIAYALLLTKRLTGQTPDLAVFGTIFPIGIMTTALPLAPGGLGVGHVAFEKLFSMVGLTQGANVFNLMVLGQLSLNLIGVVPYLMYRTKLPPMSELQTQAKRVAEG